MSSFQPALWKSVLTIRIQPNIHQVTDTVYALFRNHGYDDNRIFYPATENRPGLDGLPTVANLQAAITSWASTSAGAIAWSSTPRTVMG